MTNQNVLHINRVIDLCLGHKIDITEHVNHAESIAVLNFIVTFLSLS